jgi:hypothetical protein
MCRAEEEKRRKRAELREMIHQYELDRRHLKNRLKEEETSELNKIQEWTELQERRLNEIAAKKSMQQKLEAAKYDLVASKMEQQRKDQTEMEQLLIEMFIAEADAKIEEEIRARDARRLGQRQEMIDGLKHQQILAERKRTEQKAQEQVKWLFGINANIAYCFYIDAACSNDGEIRRRRSNRPNECRACASNEN